MALADRRPLEFSAGGFNPRSLQQLQGPGRILEALSPEDDGSADELSPTSRSILPDSLMNADTKNLTESSRGSTPQTNGTSAGQKKPKSTPRVPIATGISTTIPVTGEKPRPSQKDDPLLEDDVLYAIFLILYEKDPSGSGMTVKQICDILIERHPEMANLLTKTSNLVLAKLNAYVKRVEKGDASLKYALSRDWADALPKRMVYVYRGLLAPDFHVHVKSMMEVQKDPRPPSVSAGAVQSGNESSDPLEAGKQALLKPRRSTMFDLGINRNSFLSSSMDKLNLFVPYSSAPVTASLKDAKEEEPKEAPEEEFEDFEVFQDGDQDLMETLKKNGKRSKSMSYLTNKKHKILTAAAAAPRAPKTPCSHSPNAAAAAAALHAAAIKAINYDASVNTVKSHHNKKWLNVIRSGFLSQDIGCPEDISLSDLDKFFN